MEMVSGQNWSSSLRPLMHDQPNQFVLVSSIRAFVAMLIGFILRFVSHQVYNRTHTKKNQSD